MDIPITTIRTPDKETISFKNAEKQQIEYLLRHGKFKEVPEEYRLVNLLHPYTNHDFSQFLVIRGDGGGYLFERKEYEKYRKGSVYYEMSIFVTSERIYYSFGLNCEYSYNFIREGATLLKEYPVFDEYQTYLLKDSAVCFLRPRGVNNWYDGYWFPGMEDYKYSYKSFAY
jgi:hypothetical protein